ncbi:MAG: nucleotide sugar dehydrogenase [Armatimonadetes bacterium]|nr:nucleotide sugar dehydrogenase [Armatimonadota bacterium]
MPRAGHRQWRLGVPELKRQILERISNKTAKIGIVGLGYVGLPLGLRYVESGFEVLGFDIDPKKIEALGKGESYIRHIGEDRVRDAAQSGKLAATTDFSRIGEVDTVILCVPTPLGQHLEPDMTYIVSSLDRVQPFLRPGQMMSLESTTYPGTTRELVAPCAERAGLKIGEDIFIVFSPEREDPGNQKFSTGNTPKVVGGMTPACVEVGVAVYEAAIDKVVPVSSPDVAEMTKLLENIYRAVNIGLVNELKICCDRMNIDVWEVIDAASSKPFGFTPFYPGPGLGGHCIPIDPFYLTWKAKEYNFETRFISLAGEINRAMPEFVIEKVKDALNAREKSVRGSKVLVLGLAYKKNIDDVRESPSVELMTMLLDLGAKVSYADPLMPETPKMRRYDLGLKSVDVTPESVKEFDVVLIATDHDIFDYAMIQKSAKLIIDTRGRYRGEFPNVVKA